MASTWVKLDDDFFDHPKVIGLSLVAVHVHLRAICWCSKHLTDGRIPLAVVESWSVRRWRDAIDSLVDRGLWERPTVDLGSTYGRPTVRDPKVDEWFQIHDYLDHQRSAEDARNIKAKRAAAGAKGGQAKAAKAKQTPSKVLEAGLAEKRREDSPSSPPQISGEQPTTKAAYGGEEELTRAVLEHMARCDLDRARADDMVIVNEAGWLRTATQRREETHATAIAYEVERRTAGLHYPLHVETAEHIDPRCGPADAGAARAAALADDAEARRQEREASLAAIRSNPDAIKAGAAAARAALRTPAA